MNQRLRVFARVLPMWNPCIYAVNINTGNVFLLALAEVASTIPKISYTLTDK